MARVLRAWATADSTAARQLVHQRQQVQLFPEGGMGLQYPPAGASPLQIKRRDPGDLRSPKPPQ